MHSNNLKLDRIMSDQIIINGKNMYSEREKIIKNYIDGYNNFDIDKMLTVFDSNIIFENVQDEQVNLSLIGIDAFKQQAEQAKSYFASRKQTIKSFIHSTNETEIEIDYSAVLAMDFPNGMKKGEALNLSGKSVFTFLDDKVIKLTDIS